MRLSIIAYSVDSLFQVISTNQSNNSCSNTKKSAQIISVSTNLNLKPQNNNLVNLIFTQFQVKIKLN